MALIIQCPQPHLAIVELNEADAETLHESVLELLEQGVRDVVLDYRQVTFCTSVEVAQVLTARSAVDRAGGRLVVVNLTPNVLSIFRVLKLERLFRLDYSLEGALRDLRHGGQERAAE